MSDKYKIEVSLDGGATYTVMYPDLSKTKFTRSIGEEWNRYAVKTTIDKLEFSNKLSQKFKPNQNDFDLLVAAKANYSELPCKLYENNVLILEFAINVLAEGYDYYLEMVELKCAELPNSLTDKIRFALSTEFNVLEADEDIIANISSVAITDVYSLYWTDIVGGLAPTANDLLQYYYQFGALITPANFSNLWISSNQYTGVKDSYNYVESPDNLNALIGGKNSFVTYGGNIYLALRDTINEEPGVVPTAWYLVATDIYRFDTAASLFLGESKITTGYGFGNLLFFDQYEDRYYNSIDYRQKYYYSTVTDSIGITLIKNGRKLSTVFQQIMSEIDSNINFEPTQDATNGWCELLMNDSDYNNIVVYSISQVKFYDGDIAASFENVTLESLFKMMKYMFNLDWRINDNNYFQFIYKGTNPFTVIDKDLTTLKYKNGSFDPTKHHQKPLFINSQVVNAKREYFNYIKTKDIEFSEAYIEFETGNENTSNEAAIVCNDVVELMIGSYSGVSNDGICLMALNGSNAIKESFGIEGIRKGLVVNLPLSYKVLIYEFAADGRNKKRGNINGIIQIDLTQKEIYKTNPIELPLSISDIDFTKLYELAITKTLGITGASPMSLEKTLSDNNDKITVEFIF